MILPKTTTCKNVARVTLVEKSQPKRTGLLSLVVMLYAVAIPSLVATMGNPLKLALEQAAQLEMNRTLVEHERFVKSAEEEAVVSWDDDEGVALVVEASPSTETSTRNDTNNTSGNLTDIGASSDNNVTMEERPLPSAYLPDAVPLFFFFLVVSGHILYHLMCRWFVWFLVATQYSPASHVIEGRTYAYLSARTHRGKDDLAPWFSNPVTGVLEFVFQRQTYEYLREGDADFRTALRMISSSMGDESGGGVERVHDEEEEGDEDEEDVEVERLAEEEEEKGSGTKKKKMLATDEERQARRRRCAEIAARRGLVRLVVSKVDLQLSKYLDSIGLATEEAIALQRSQFGPNTLAVPQPPFVELLKTQLLMPLSVFQLFSALLWAVDEYIQYTLFTLFTIVLMESTTAFQRHRTMTQLRGLQAKPFSVLCFRCGAWTPLPTDQLLPGDLISLRPSPGSGELVVPCDALLLSGSAVVNEATLTGESVPQMKDALKREDRALDIDGADRVSTLFSGTALVAAAPGISPSRAVSMLHREPPDQGAVCVVLRTGFSSSQGELMQMIEYSSQAVSADSKETGAALLILLVFALVSASYVVKKGLEKGDRTTHELLLKAIIIVTSVVPRQLPVQMALAVNHALMALMREGIYCTEPFRVPQAGKITNVLFDKTGTLTSDELVPAGVVNDERLVPVHEAGEKATMVLSACHSLVSLASGPPNATNGENETTTTTTTNGGNTTTPSPSNTAPTTLLGDPIELAAVRGVRWRYDGNTQECLPGVDDAPRLAALAKLREKHAASPPGSAAREAIEKEIAAGEKTIAENAERAKNSPIERIAILKRFHFEAALQRMSVIARVVPNHNVPSSDKKGYVAALVKGSPEALASLVDVNEHPLPSWYESCYQSLSERGMRVLALGMKRLPASVGTPSGLESISRREAETGLEFVGFVAFECKVRADSPAVVGALAEAGIDSTMVTGDAAPTALHVAGVCRFLKHGPSRALVLDKSGAFFRGALTSTREIRRDLRLEDADGGLARVANEGYDLLATEEALEALSVLSNRRVWSGISYIRVLARMSPRGKAKAIRAMQHEEEVTISGSGGVGRNGGGGGGGGGHGDRRYVMMCGDGGNDVGALKQADVGLALLSGYGSANTASTTGAGETESGTITNTAASSSSQNALNARINDEKKRHERLQKLRNEELEIKRKALMQLQRQWTEEELARLPPGSGIMAQMSVLKTVGTRMRNEMAAEAAALDRKYGLAAMSGGGDPNKSLDDALGEVEGAGGALPVIRPGDASVAAAFTSRVPSVRSAVHLVRQGRCTLLSALQQQQIMMLECTITAYTYAAVSLEGSRTSERQMMVSGWLVMTASLAFSYSTPLEHIHPVRPLRSLFHPAVFLSIAGQALVHMYCMTSAVRLASETMGPAALAEVVAFNRRVRAGQETETVDEDDPLKVLASIWGQPFKPNLMNTTVFLVETAQIMSVLFVNYKGRPFMKGMLENHALFWSLFLCIGGVAFAAWEVMPQANAAIHLYPFPDDAYRFTVMGYVLATIFGTCVWDRLVTFLFAREIFQAMVQSAKETTLMDLLPVALSFIKSIGGLLIFSTGNPIIWFGAWYFWKKINAPT